MNRKVIAIMLIVALCMSVFVGCSKKEAAPAEEASASAAPVAQEKVVLTVWEST